MKRKIVSITAMVMAISLIMIPGCDRSAYDGEVIDIYYLRDISAPISEDAIEAVQVPVNQYGNRAEQAVNLLLTEPDEDGLVKPFPDDVELVGVEHSGEVVTVHLSEEYAEMFGASLAAANACTVLTLCAIDGVSSVNITAKGRAHPTFSAENMSADRVVTGDMSLKPVEFQAVLYYSDGNTEYVVGEYKNIIMRENESIARYVVEELIKGPDGDSSAEGYKSIINSNAKLLNIEVSNKICYVNFSKEFLDGLYKSRAIEVQTLYSITNSLCSIEDIEGVQYLVEGDRIYGNDVMRKNETVIGPHNDETISENIYMVSADSKYLETLPVRIEAITGFDIERLVIEKLISGIDGYGFMSMIPKGTMLLGVEMDRHTCIVDFSKEFTANYTGIYDSDLIIQSIVTSLTHANNNVRNVLIKVEGEPIGDGEPISPDDSLVGVG